ncbi:MAG: cyclic pyranopterin monophosphate synthase MoaC [Planctomycetales bacterium]|nr:cyclic pyranopterin monophosphate synthase MoaC [Planctomycetales bacterium]
MNQLSHFDDSGASRMVDVSEKTPTHRIAVASVEVVMQPETMTRIRDKSFAKGDVLEVARLAGIMASKKTPDLIPLCHPIAISGVTIDFDFPSDVRLSATATVKTTGQTGVEMEALTAASVTALTVYDMCKSIDKGISIERLQLLEKQGGKSGHFKRLDASDDEGNSKD